MSASLRPEQQEDGRVYGARYTPTLPLLRTNPKGSRRPGLFHKFLRCRKEKHRVASVVEIAMSKVVKQDVHSIKYAGTGKGERKSCSYGIQRCEALDRLCEHKYIFMYARPAKS
jgi:hypothetical protein